MRYVNTNRKQLIWEDLRVVEGCALIVDGKFDSIYLRFKKLNPFLETRNMDQLRDIHRILTQLFEEIEEIK